MKTNIKYLFLVFGILSLLWFNSYGYALECMVISGSAAATCDTDFTEPCAGDCSANWNEDNGSWTLNNTMNGQSETGEHQWARYTADSVDTTQHWVKVEVATFVDASYPGVMLCSEGDGGDKYLLMIHDNGNYYAQDFDDDTTEGSNTAGDANSLSNGEIFAVACECAGSGDITFYIWENPSGSPDCPTGWGAADVTIVHTPTYRATGTGVGLYEWANDNIFDNFVAGDWSD